MSGAAEDEEVVEMPEQPRGFLVAAGNGRPTRVATPGSSFKAVGADTGGTFTVLEYVVVQSVPLHRHAREHESLYVLEGDLQVRVGEDRFHVSRGDFVFMPQGLPHALQVVDEGSARILAISSPSGFELFIEDLMEALAAGHDRTSAEVAAIRQKHQWVPVE